MKMFRKGQGATEYLLMLAAVLVIVAIAVYYVTSAGPSALISGTAENVGDDIVFTPSTPMTPTTIPAADWEYQVSSDGTIITAFTTGPSALEVGVPVTLTDAGDDGGDKLTIRLKRNTCSRFR